jgi:hypothetical protein
MVSRERTASLICLPDRLACPDRDQPPSSSLGFSDAFEQLDELLVTPGATVGR